MLDSRMENEHAERISFDADRREEEKEKYFFFFSRKELQSVAVRRGRRSWSCARVA